MTDVTITTETKTKWGGTVGRRTEQWQELWSMVLSRFKEVPLEYGHERD